MFPDLGQTAMFSVMALVLMFSIIFLTGMYPVKARMEKMQRIDGRVLVGLCVLSSVSLFAAVIWTAISVQWPFLVIGGGLGFLVAPMIYQLLPVQLLEGRFGAGLLFVTNAGLALLVASNATPLNI